MAQKAYIIYLSVLVTLFIILVGAICYEEIPDRRVTRDVHTDVLRDGSWDGVPRVRVRYVLRQPH